MTNSTKLTIIGKIALAAIFLYSGWVKIQDLPAFSTSVASFKLVPAWAIPAVVATIPPAEIIAALLLFWRRTHGGAATCITLLCAGFCCFYAYAWMKGIHPTCGCFGNNPLLQASPPEGILRAGIIGAIAFAILKHIQPKPIKSEDVEIREDF